jgi:hypothetical protein
MTEDTKQISLRQPVGLLERVQAVADKERRSLNSQITVMLEKALADGETA